MTSQSSISAVPSGDQPDTPDPLVRAEAAISAALAEFERLDHNAVASSNGRVVAEIIEAREDLRQMCRDRTREVKSGAAAAPAKVPACIIGDLLNGTDRELGRYITENRDSFRRFALNEAVLNAHALTDAIASIDEEAAKDFTVQQLALMANTLLARAQHLEAEGGNNE